VLAARRSDGRRAGQLAAPRAGTSNFSGSSRTGPPRTPHHWRGFDRYQKE